MSNSMTLRRLLVATIFWFALVPANAQDTVKTAIKSNTEHNIKTAIVFKLLRFVSWPDEVLENSNTINVCLRRNEAFYEAFKEIEGSAIDERTLNVVLLSKVRMPQCHVVFVSSENNLLVSDWRIYARKGVLTVSDSENFALQGGMINLFMREQRVSFRMNIAALTQADLQISSLVLKLAEIVRSAPGLPQIGVREELRNE
ncbi:MAG: YfiR family protein [Pseudomonadales bacterium]